MKKLIFGNNGLLDNLVAFQTPASPIMEGIVDLHNDIMVFLIFVVFLVLYFLLEIFLFPVMLASTSGTPDWDIKDHFWKSRKEKYNLLGTSNHKTSLEIVWTLVPTLILVAIAIPSYTLLYSMDELFDPAVTLKVIGRQWYWSYEYTDINGLEPIVDEFDSIQASAITRPEQLPNPSVEDLNPYTKEILVQIIKEADVEEAVEGAHFELDDVITDICVEQLLEKASTHAAQNSTTFQPCDINQKTPCFPEEESMVSNDIINDTTLEEIIPEQTEFKESVETSLNSEYYEQGEMTEIVIDDILDSTTLSMDEVIATNVDAPWNHQREVVYNLYKCVVEAEKTNNVVFDSYLDQDLEETSLFRQLKVDNDVYLPVQTFIRVLVTSTDVIHSWALPALGIKVDATPGRLNQISVYIERIGQYFGQCSELCGLNHAFMPISVVAAPLEVYLNFIDNA